MADEKSEAPVDDVETPTEDTTEDGPEAPTSEGDGATQAAAEDAPEDDETVDAPAASEPADEEPQVSEAKKRADAIIAQRQVTRRTITSKRVTPKAGAKADANAAPVTSKARNARVTEQIHARYTPPEQTYAKGPSPWWVPAIMFGLLIIGALIIMLNYMGLFGDAENIRLVIGLAFILGGIITATQYR